MKPIGPLMREHRLIERMVAVLNRELANLTNQGSPDLSMLMVAIDFFRTYADRTHHGKEEDILFRELARKQLQPQHKQVMDELIQEHIWARKTVSRLADAQSSYEEEVSQALKEMIECIQELVQFYPAHIIKEDQNFFYLILDHFSKTEQNNMLSEFWEFDRKLIHEKYLKIVEESENTIK